MTVRINGDATVQRRKTMNNYEKYRQVRKEAAGTALLLLILIVA